MNTFTLPSIQTRPMRFDDLPQVVEIHCQQFRTSRSASLGKPFVRKMYHWFIAYQPSLAFIVDEDTRILGFVTGSIGGYGRAVFRYAFGEVALGLLMHPSLFFNKRTFTLGRSYLKGLLPNSTSSGQTLTSSGPRKASLASIAVAQIAQGRGVGKALVYAFEAGARQLDVVLLGLSVEAENISARCLYESCGWQVDDGRSNASSAYYVKSL